MEKAVKFSEMYDDELRSHFTEEDEVENLSWAQFKRYADKKEAGM